MTIDLVAATIKSLGDSDDYSDARLPEAAMTVRQIDASATGYRAFRSWALQGWGRSEETCREAWRMAWGSATKQPTYVLDEAAAKRADRLHVDDLPVATVTDDQQPAPPTVADPSPPSDEQAKATRYELDDDGRIKRLATAPKVASTGKEKQAAIADGDPQPWSYFAWKDALGKR